VILVLRERGSGLYILFHRRVVNHKYVTLAQRSDRITAIDEIESVPKPSLPFCSSLTTSARLSLVLEIRSCDLNIEKTYLRKSV
jgi:hypothetical protein